MNFKRSISKLLSFVMCFALLLSMGSFAFADGEEPCQHVYDEGVVTTEPSCTAAGVKTYTCTVDGCGDTYTEPVDLVDHSYAEGKCTVCGTDEPAGEPEPVPNSCTGDENCTADGDDVVHSGTCPKAAAAKDKPPVDTGIGCTGDVNCSADGDDIIHTGDCPKASAVIVEPPVCTCATKCSNDAPDANCQVCASSADLSADCVGCTGEKDCHAITHVSACLSLVCTCMKPCEGGGIDTDCPVCNDSTDISVDCKGQIPDPTYIDHGSGQLNGEDMQRIVEFKTVADKNGYRYEDWYAEFYLSFTGFVGTIDMGGSSLGGILHSFGDLTRVLSFPSGTNVSANQSVGIVNLLAVMEGLTVFENGIPWEMVCDGERFTCSIYVNPDILNKYPDFKVNLSLVLKAPDLSSTIYLENIDYDVPALLGITDPVARIDNAAGGSYYETLEDAIADSTNGDIITVLDDVILNSAVTLKSGTTLLPGDHTVTGTVNSTIILKTGDTVLGYYTELNSALTAANKLSGEVTVEIYDKVEYTADTPALNGKYSSISFVGKTDDAEIDFTRNDDGGYIEGGGKVVSFTELKLSKSVGGWMPNAAQMNCCFTVHGAASVTYTRCDFPNGACAAGAVTTYRGCTFGKSHDKYGLWIYGNTTTLVDGCTFSGPRGIKLYSKTSNLTVENTKFLYTDDASVSHKPAIVLTHGASVTLSGNTYPSQGVFELDTGADTSSNGTPVTADIADIACMNDDYTDCGVLMDGKIYIDIEAAIAAEGENKPITLFYDPAKDISLEESATIVDNGNTPSGEITITDVDVTLTAPEGLNVVSGVSGYVVFYNNGVYRLGVYIAETGGESYETIAAAVAAAADGGTVKLLRSSSESFTANKNITFDPNGFQYTGTVAVAAGKVMTVDIADLQAQTSGLKLGAGQGSLSVGGKQIALPQGGTVTAAADGSITAAPNGSTGDLAPVKYNGFTLLVTNSALTIRADGSVDIPVGSTVVFPSGNTVIAMHGGVLSADGVLSTTPAQEQEYGYGKVSIVDADGNKYTAFVPTGSELKVQEKNGALVYSSSSKEAPIVCKGDLAKPVLTIDPKRKAFYKYGLGTLKFTCNGFSSTLVRISVDNVGLNDNAYTVEAGSTIIKLKNEYLKTLALGDHVLKLTYADGQTVTATISVVNTPVTGDSNHLALFTLMMAGCLASATGLFLILRKRSKG